MQQRLAGPGKFRTQRRHGVSFDGCTSGEADVLELAHGRARSVAADQVTAAPPRAVGAAGVRRDARGLLLDRVEAAAHGDLDQPLVDDGLAQGAGQRVLGEMQRGGRVGALGVLRDRGRAEPGAFQALRAPLRDACAPLDALSADPRAVRAASRGLRAAYRAAPKGPGAAHRAVRRAPGAVRIGFEVRRVRVGRPGSEVDLAHHLLAPHRPPSGPTETGIGERQARQALDERGRVLAQHHRPREPLFVLARPLVEDHAGDLLAGQRKGQREAHGPRADDDHRVHGARPPARSGVLRNGREQAVGTGCTITERMQPIAGACVK